jgi:outer membrane protein, adhesin transport system
MEHHSCTYRQRYQTLVLVCLLLLITTATQAQTLNLYDAVEKTISNYPLLRQRAAEVAAGRAHVTTVGSYRLPSLTLNDQVNVGTSNSMAGSYFPLGLVPSTSGSINAINENNLASGNIAISSLEWDFYNFGYRNAEKKEAQAQEATIEANMNSDKYRITEDVVSVYLDWLKKYRLLQIENVRVQRNTTILGIIRASVLSGLKAGVDSSTASATYARARIGYLQALNEYKYDQIALASYTMLDTTVIRPDTSIFSPAFQQKVTLFQPTDSISTVHPLLDVYQKEYEQQLSTNETVAKKYLPKFSLEGAAWMRGSSISPADEYSTNLGDGLSYSRYNYLAGLTLTYNVFDLKHRHDQIVEGRYAAKAKQEAIQNQQLTLNQLLQQANSAYATTMDKLKELPAQLHSSQQAYVQQLALYKAGLNTLIDVTNAEYVLSQTETSFALAQNDLMQLLYIRAGLSNQSDLFLQNFKQ